MVEDISENYDIMSEDVDSLYLHLIEWFEDNEYVVIED